ALPTFGRLVVGDGHVLYTDGVLPARIDARFALSDGNSRGERTVAAEAATAASTAEIASAPARATAASDAASRGIVIRAGGAAGGGPTTVESVRLAPGERGLRLKATGQYRQLPVRIDLSTAGVLALLGKDAEAQSQPLSLHAVVGRAEGAFDGTTRDPLHFTGLKGRFRLTGQSLANVGDALGITLP